MEQTTARGRITSHVPGRLRIRLTGADRKAHILGHVQESLVDRSGVHAVHAKQTSGSLVVHYDPEAVSPGGILTILDDVGVLIHGVLGDGEIGEPGLADDDEGGNSHAANTIMGALDDLDQRLSRLTGRKVDLKMLVPLGIGVLGLNRLRQSGLGLAEGPAWVLLWYAFDSFYKLHVPAPRPPATDGADTSLE